MSHHELPEHDALDTIDEKVLKGELFFERHGKKIIIAVAAVVIVALGISLTTASSKSLRLRRLPHRCS